MTNEERLIIADLMESQLKNQNLDEIKLDNKNWEQNKSDILNSITNTGLYKLYFNTNELFENRKKQIEWFEKRISILRNFSIPLYTPNDLDKYV